MLKKFSLLAFILAVFSTHSFPAEETRQAALEQLKAWGIKEVGSGEIPIGDDYAHFKKTNGKWALESFSKKRPSVRRLDSEEIIVFSNDLSKLQPDFRNWEKNARGNTACTVGGLDRVAEDRKTYNPCDSYLTSVSNYNVAYNTLVILATIGTRPNATEVKVDPERIVDLLIESEFGEKINSIRANKWLNAYRHKFDAILSSLDARNFVSEYGENDPEQLVPRAIEKQSQLIAAEIEKENEAAKKRAERYRIREEKERIEREEQELNRQRYLEREAANAKRRESVAATFRKKLKVGDETACGPVIEIKLPMVKVSAIHASGGILSGYPSEQWFRLTELYPKSEATCSPYNGLYKVQLLPTY